LWIEDSPQSIAESLKFKRKIYVKMESVKWFFVIQRNDRVVVGMTREGQRARTGA